MWPGLQRAKPYEAKTVNLIIAELDTQLHTISIAIEQGMVV